MDMAHDIQGKFGDLAEKIRSFPSEMEAWENARGIWARLLSKLKASVPSLDISTSGLLKWCPCMRDSLFSKACGVSTRYCFKRQRKL